MTESEKVNELLGTAYTDIPNIRNEKAHDILAVADKLMKAGCGELLVLLEMEKEVFDQMTKDLENDFRKKLLPYWAGFQTHLKRLQQGKRAVREDSHVVSVLTKSSKKPKKSEYSTQNAWKKDTLVLFADKSELENKSFICKRSN